jgi:hypothetical protein
MMKHLKSLAIALLLTTTFIACKKDSTPPPFTMNGIWEGKIGDNNDAPDGQYKLNIKANGVIERISFNGNVSATGTWLLEGDEFSGHYIFADGNTIVTLEGTVDKQQKKLTGTWENDGDEVGTFYATQKN